MTLVRRTIAVFLVAYGVTGLFLYPSSCVGLRSNPPHYFCDGRPADELWGWLFAGLLVGGAAVLWLAPWRRHRNRLTGRLWVPARVKRNLARVGGWVLVVIGGSVIFYSVGGLFRSAPDCSWEIGCYDFDFILGGAFREDAFSLSRVVGVSSGVALLGWGFLELRLEVERFLRVAILGLGLVLVLVVLADPLGYGFRGIGTVQLVSLASVLVLTLSVVVTRKRLFGLRERFGPLRGYHREFLLVATTASIILGSWVTVLDRIEPRCAAARHGLELAARLVRCEHELRSTSVVAASIVAAGLYVAYARWQTSDRTPTTVPRTQTRQP